MRTSRFSGGRLKSVRHFRQLTQEELASLVALSPSTISLYENGRRQPDDQEIIEALCDVLDVRPHYFYSPFFRDLTEVDLDYRRLAAAPKKVRDQMIAYGAFVLDWVRYLRQEVMLPALDVPLIDAAYDDDIERAAEECRGYWGLGVGPIHSITRVLENAGIAVAMVETRAREVDAFSIYADEQGIVVLNTAKGSSSRAIQDCAHELGHGVLHRGAGRSKDLKLKEHQAKRFAGAFLLPRQTFPREFWSNYNGRLPPLIELKRRWGVSIQALLYRAYQLDLIGAAEFRRWMRQVSKRGWRSGAPEPAEPEPLGPELLDRAFARYQQVTGETPQKIREFLGWGDTIFAAVTGTAGDGIERDPSVRSLGSRTGRTIPH